MKNSLKITAYLVGAALLVALVVGVSFDAFWKIKDAARARKHAFMVLEGANGLLSDLKDADAGRRGYTLTGDEAFLEPYWAGQDGLRGRLQELRQFTSNSLSQKHLDVLATLMDAEMAGMATVIELHRNRDTAAMHAAVRNGQEKRLMDAMRAELGGLIKTEEGLLAKCDALFQSDMRRLFVILVTASLFALLFALLFAYLTYLETLNCLKSLVHDETRHLLKIQKKTNQQLYEANVILRLSEERLYVTLQCIGEGLIGTDAEGRVTLRNPAAERLLVWTQVEPIGCPVDEVFRIVNNLKHKSEPEQGHAPLESVGRIVVLSPR